MKSPFYYCPRVALPYLSCAALPAGIMMLSWVSACAGDGFGSGSNAFVIDFVEVGNSGNPDDTGGGGGSYSSGHGAVAYPFRLGVTEVSQDWITKATNLGMTNVESGDWSSDRPATSVTWFEAAAFVNWLNTISGNQAAYNMTWNGSAWTMDVWPLEEAWTVGGENRFRHKNAFYFLPGEDEWYKGAFHKGQGVDGEYWDFATGSNSGPVKVGGGTTAGTAVIDVPGQAPAPVNQSGGLSPYGTRGQTGNVWEWVESALDGSNNLPFEERGTRGGGWNNPLSLQNSGVRNSALPDYSSGECGFRIASRSLVGLDSDSDGLDDSAETNTGVYVSPANTGTNPDNPDSDADGVPDGLEVKEATSPVDGTKFNSFSKGMVVYYPFNSNTQDWSGSSNHGIPQSGCAFTVDRYGNAGSALEVNRSQVLKSTKNLGISGNSSCSASFWFYTEGEPVWANGYLLSMGRGEQGQMFSPTYCPWATDFGNTGNMRLDAFYAGSEISSSPRKQSGKWTQFIVTYNANLDGTKIYVDGKAYAAQPIEENGQFTCNWFDSPLWINGSIGSPNGIDGKFDDVRFYNRAISSEEAAMLYHYERPVLQVIQGTYTWHEAKADAEARGGRLAVLDTQTKIDGANAFLQASFSEFDLWIGITDEIVEGQWKWVDGSELGVDNWGSGEPNNANNEDYGSVTPLTASLGSFGWNDLPDSGGGYIEGYLFEQLQASASVSFTTATNGSITGSGDYEVGTKATLTAIPNPGFSFTGWTGDASGTANPLLLVVDTDKTVGATFAPDLTDNDSDGLTAYDEAVVYGTDPAKDDTDGDGLKDGWEVGRGRFAIVPGNFTWAQARADAKAKSGDLASFPDEHRWKRAMETLGATALDNFTGLWIGASDAATDGSWTWVNGEAFSFQPWGTGRPSNAEGNTLDYAEVSGGAGSEIGKWYDRSPTTIRDGYLLETGYATDPKVADADADGLNDGQEQAAGSNPFLGDTDSDGLNDGQEVNLTHTNPKLADTDGDGLNDAADDEDGDTQTNLAEISQHGTDPLKADTDGDGVNDGTELQTTGSHYQLVAGSFTYPQAAADAVAKRGRVTSFPTSNTYQQVIADVRQTNTGFLWIGLSDLAAEGTWVWTDGGTATYHRWLNGQPDGNTGENQVVVMENGSQWADAAENFVAAGYILERVGLNPLAADTDGDGLTDGRELNTVKSSPFWSDTDGDGLQDGAEVDTHGSSPLLPDTDSDGLGDRDEVEIYHSNPSVKDTDGDGFDDWFEVNTGFNPVLATSTPDAVSSIRTAVEFRFNAANGVSYRIEGSTDLSEWSTIETGIIGTGGVVTRFYSTENIPKRYFRARRN